MTAERRRYVLDRLAAQKPQAVAFHWPGRIVAFHGPRPPWLGEGLKVPDPVTREFHFFRWSIVAMMPHRPRTYEDDALTMPLRVWVFAADEHDVRVFGRHLAVMFERKPE